MKVVLYRFFKINVQGYLKLFYIYNFNNIIVFIRLFLLKKKVFFLYIVPILLVGTYYNIINYNRYIQIII